MRSVSRLAVIAVAAGGLLAAGPALALVAANAHGYDVSWPQCGRSLPVDGDARVVGVTGGKPYDDGNPCLGDQYRWAVAGAGGAAQAAFYVNTANPGPVSSVLDWYGQKSPNARCSRSDEAACAYNYGYNGARLAWSYAQTKTGAAARHSWWLDVETTNSWSSDPSLNVADVLGAVAFLRSQGVPVGVYSTEWQWDHITGGAHLTDVSNWVAGAASGAQAASWCGPDSSFTGGPVVLVQWIEDDLDHDHSCRPLPAVTGKPAKPGLDTVLQDLLTLNLGKLLQDLQAK